MVSYSFARQLFLWHIRCRILSASVRDNILFSHEYDEQFYNMVIDGLYVFVSTSSLDFTHHLLACALRHDLNLLPQGDLTEVGEKGINIFFLLTSKRV